MKMHRFKLFAATAPLALIAWRASARNTRSMVTDPVRMFGRAAIVVAGVLAFATPARAQINFGTLPEESSAVCQSGGTLLLLVNEEDCQDAGSGFSVYSYRELNLGPAGDVTHFDLTTGEVTFNAAATFTDIATFESQTTFRLRATFQQITDTNGIRNNGNIATGTLSTTGLATLNSLQVANNGAIGGELTVAGFASLNNGLGVTNGLRADTITATQSVRTPVVSISSTLNVSSGATVDMGGNRVQNIGTPQAGTDAANRDYVDASVAAINDAVATQAVQIAAAQTTANSALTVATAAAGSATAAQATADAAVANAAAAQATADTAITRSDSLGASTVRALGGGSAYNSATASVSAPSYAIGGESYSSVGGAFAAVDGRLGEIDGRINALSENSDRRIRQANGGIAAAMALGGTVMPPDMRFAVSFNLATYRGEQGFSGSLVARVTNHVWVSGGVAGSTVRGSTGGRAGVTFGW
jgi:hypothetical protein